MKNPNGAKPATHLSPKEIIEDIVALDAECAEVLKKIEVLLK